MIENVLSQVAGNAPSKALDVDGTSRVLQDAYLQRLRQTATRLSQGIVEAHRHVQQLSHGIMPMQIEGEGLTAALAELANSNDVEQKLRCRSDNPTPVLSNLRVKCINR